VTAAAAAAAAADDDDDYAIFSRLFIMFCLFAFCLIDVIFFVISVYTFMNMFLPNAVLNLAFLFVFFYLLFIIIIIINIIYFTLGKLSRGSLKK